MKSVISIVRVERGRSTVRGRTSRITVLTYRKKKVHANDLETRNDSRMRGTIGATLEFHLWSKHIIRWLWHLLIKLRTTKDDESRQYVSYMFGRPICHPDIRDMTFRSVKSGITTVNVCSLTRVNHHIICRSKSRNGTCVVWNNKLTTLWSCVFNFFRVRSTQRIRSDQCKLDFNSEVQLQRSSLPLWLSNATTHHVFRVTYQSMWIRLVVIGAQLVSPRQLELQTIFPSLVFSSSVILPAFLIHQILLIFFIFFWGTPQLSLCFRGDLCLRRQSVVKISLAIVSDMFPRTSFFSVVVLLSVLDGCSSGGMRTVIVNVRSNPDQYSRRGSLSLWLTAFSPAALL